LPSATSIAPSVPMNDFVTENAMCWRFAGRIGKYFS
jgi:hypothetical protein